MVLYHYAESTAANESTHKEAPALTSLSESISLLNQCAATEFSVEHSHFESSIVDNASISEGMMDSDPPHPTDYPRASEAFSPLSLPSSLSKGDPCSYSGFSSDCDRSRSMPPVNQRYQQEDAYFHTPIIRKPHPHVIQRRYTYPPAAGYSFCTPSTSDLVGLLCDIWICVHLNVCTHGVFMVWWEGMVKWSM